jgi:hypothetical protein
VERFVGQDSEGGRRAQAVAAGMMDLLATAARVEAGRINDPDRHLPGDVGVRPPDGASDWERVFEVRDKPVAGSDLTIFARKAAESGVSKAAVLAVAEAQPRLEERDAVEFAATIGVELTVFWGWRSFIEQSVVWSPHPRHLAAVEAYNLIRERLIQVEVSEQTLDIWDVYMR